MAVATQDDAALLAAEEAKIRAEEEAQAKAAADEELRQSVEAARIEAAKTEEQKAQDRLAYELRKEREKREALEKENNDYKRRADEERKAKLTEEQRVKEERDELKAQLEKLESEKLQAKIAAEFRLPPALADRIRGTDEAAMRADAEELSKLVTRRPVGTITDPDRQTNNGTIQTFKRSQLRDPEFYKTHKEAIGAAAAAGRIIDG